MIFMASRPGLVGLDDGQNLALLQMPPYSRLLFGDVSMRPPQCHGEGAGQHPARGPAAMMGRNLGLIGRRAMAKPQSAQGAAGHGAVAEI